MSVEARQWWPMSLIPAIWEAEADGSLRSTPAWFTERPISGVRRWGMTVEAHRKLY